MKESYKKSIIGSAIAFILGTSCCWITSVAVYIGGATILTAFATCVDRFNTLIIIFAIIPLVLGVMQLLTHRQKLRKQN